MPAIRPRPQNDADRPVRGNARRVIALAVGMLLPVALTTGTATYAGRRPAQRRRSPADRADGDGRPGRGPHAAADRPRHPVGRLRGRRAAVRRAGHAGQRPDGSVPQPGHPRLLRRARQRRRHLLGHARQRLRRQGRTRPTSCSGSTSSSRAGSAPAAEPGRSRSCGYVSLSRPAATRSTSRSSTSDTRRRLLTGADFDIESLQRDGRRRLLDRRRVRPVPPARRLARPAARRAGRRSRSAVAAEPDARRRPTADTQPQRRVRGDGRSRPNDRYLYPILEKALVDEPDPRRRVISQFDTRTRPLHRPDLGLPRRHRRQPGRRRPDGPRRHACSSSSATTSTATPR